MTQPSNKIVLATPASSLASTPSRLVGVKNYLREHAVAQGYGFYFVHTPMHVYKAVWRSGGYNRVVANLVIPKGAKVYCYSPSEPSRGQRKCRASEAFVHSLWEVRRRNLAGAFEEVWREVPSAVSDHDPRFKYRKGLTVAPGQGFYERPVTCAPGIHFFFDYVDALYYY